MSAFLKIDRCSSCSQEIPWEWVPEIRIVGRPLAGTGVWRSRLLDGLCPRCVENEDAGAEAERRRLTQRGVLMRLLGGIKPYDEFTLERFRVDPGNQSAVRAAHAFDPLKHNLYLWSRSRNGKTHLACAIARSCFLRGYSIEVLKAAQLVRRLRMRPPEDEQRTVTHFVDVDVLLLDDFGFGHDTPYGRQVLIEILDARAFRGKGGLLIATRCSPRLLASRWSDDTVVSRIEEMCNVLEMRKVSAP